METFTIRIAQVLWRYARRKDDIFKAFLSERLPLASLHRAKPGATFAVLYQAIRNHAPSPGVANGLLEQSLRQLLPLWGHQWSPLRPHETLQGSGSFLDCGSLTGAELWSLLPWSANLFVTNVSYFRCTATSLFSPSNVNLPEKDRRSSWEESSPLCSAIIRWRPGGNMGGFSLVVDLDWLFSYRWIFAHFPSAEESHT